MKMAVGLPTVFPPMTDRGSGGPKAQKLLRNRRDSEMVSRLVRVGVQKHFD